jgi:cytoskeletal protein RodZ
MSKLKIPTAGTVLIWVLASVQATRFARAFVLSEAVHNGVSGIPALDQALKWAALAGGLLMGAGVSFSIAHVASTWRNLKQTTSNAKQASRDSRWILLAVLLVSPFVLAQGGDAWMSWTWYRSVLLAIIPDGMVAALAFVDVSTASSQTTQKKSKPARSSSQPVRNAKEEALIAQAVREQCEKLQTEYACTEEQCGWGPDVDALVVVAGKGKDPRRSAASAKAGHYKSRHPKPIQVPIQVDSSLLIRSESPAAGGRDGD